MSSVTVTSTALPHPDGRAGSGETRGSSWWQRLLVVLSCGLLSALLYLPNVAVEEFDHEEGRRALPAREMIATGDYVRPTIWGRPFLTKPPLYFWLVGGAGLWTGEVDEWATRLPSVLATIATACAIAAFGLRVTNLRTAWMAGLLFPVSALALEKGTVGETDALLTGLTFGAVASLWGTRSGGRAARTVVAGLLLAAALMTKGPPALVPFAAGALALALAGRLDRAQLARVGLALVIGFVPLALWSAAVVHRAPEQEVVAGWLGQLSGGSHVGLGEYVGKRFEFVLGVVAGFLPSSLILVLAWRRSEVLRHPWVRFAGTVAAAIGLAFLVAPRVHTRYALPALPWTCLVAAALLDACLRGHGAAASRLLHATRISVLAGGGAAVALVVLALRAERLTVQPDGWTVVLAGALAGTAWLARSYVRARRLGPALAASLAVIVALRLTYLSQILPVRADHDGRRRQAAQLEDLLPSEAIGLGIWGEFNTLSYVDRTFFSIQDAAAGPAGSVLLLTSEGARDLERRTSVTRLGTTKLRDVGEVVAVRLGS